MNSRSWRRPICHDADRYLAAAVRIYPNLRRRESQPMTVCRRNSSSILCCLARWAEYLQPYLQVERTSDANAPHAGRCTGFTGSMAWRAWLGADGRPCPCVTFNPLPRDGLRTITFPPRWVVVHPGPQSGVAIGWKSPVSGAVQIRGRVIDADAHCGNGITWRMSLVADPRRSTWPPAVSRTAASRSSPPAMAEHTRGGEGEGRADDSTGGLSQGGLHLRFHGRRTGDRRARGDRRSVATCARSAARSAGDGEGNPQADAFGNAAVWSFYEVPDVQTAAWRQAIRSFRITS